MSPVRSAKKKPSIMIVYNEPVSGWGLETRKYVAENGHLHEGRKRLAAGTMVVKTAPGADGTLLDLSEVGVLEEMEDIARALKHQGYKTTIFNVNADIGRFVAELEERRPNLVFNVVESVGNESIHEMHAVGVFELMEIPYTGSPPIVLGLCLNKVIVKQLLLHNGLSTPAFQLVESPVKYQPDPSLRYPLFIKPAHEDASIGIDAASIVHSPAEARRRVRFVFEEYKQPVLVEEYIEGRELNVGILGNDKPVVFPISEIDMSKLPEGLPHIVTYNSKWLRGSAEYELTNGVCPANLPAKVETTVKEMALEAYRLVGCRDYARVDFRLDASNKPYILEVNPNPDLSDDAGFARSAAASGLTFNQLINKIVECALERMS